MIWHWLEVRQDDDEPFASAYLIDDDETGSAPYDRRIELVATLHDAGNGKVRAERLDVIKGKTNNRNTFKDIYSASSRMATEAGVPNEVVIKANVKVGR